jgi:hypothetical protein
VYFSPLLTCEVHLFVPIGVGLLVIIICEHVRDTFLAGFFSSTALPLSGACLLTLVVRQQEKEVQTEKLGGVEAERAYNDQRS